MVLHQYATATPSTPPETESSRHSLSNWRNKRLREAIDQLYKLFYYDRLYIGGGNSVKITTKLPKNVTIISNEDGILGGIKLWERDLDEFKQ